MLSLDHTIVPAKDKEKSAKWMADILGLDYTGLWGHFAPVKVNEKTTFDFDTREAFEAHHYALLASDQEFDEILGRVKGEGIPYGSGPRSRTDMEINHHYEGRGFYFEDTDCHVWEVITHTYGDVPVQG
jgi:catechol 2,3-dioxygenase-like lactoylglutathione lyase family enzyme